MSDVLLMRTPEAAPLGWPVTRHAVDDIWALYVQPTIDAGEAFPTPEHRALEAILEELYAALPDNPEPRRYKPST